MNTMLEMGQKILATQPFSRFLGAEMTGFGPEGLEITLPLREEFHQQYGFAHGGVISYLADNALTFAGATALGPNVITSEFKINYVRPGIGAKLAARAKVKAAGKRQAVTICDIFAIDEADEEKLCATAQGTITLR